MALTNSQYDAVMRQYSRRQAQDEHDLEDRRLDAFGKVPQLQELERETARTGASMARRSLAGESTEEERRKLSYLAQQRRDLLVKNGFPADYLEMHYFCSDCRDTGYIGNERCHCLRQAEIDYLYSESGLQDIVKTENFSTFRLDYYPDDLVNPSTGMSARETMDFIYKRCLDFAENFDEKHGSLFMYGGTGLGKTFLSHCIAGRLLDSAHSVMYYSSADLFDSLAREKFGSSRTQETPAEASAPAEELLHVCDLLIIDDLGTEIANSFVLSTLFGIINERLNKNKSIIISTNMALPTFRDTYSDRIFSRISSGFELLGFYGRDIRFLKKFN